MGGRAIPLTAGLIAPRPPMGLRPPVHCVYGSPGFVDRLKKVKFGKRSASGQRRIAVVKLAPECGHVVKSGVLRTCPHVHAQGLLVHGQIWRRPLIAPNTVRSYS
jgi:hypothetical protein